MGLAGIVIGMPCLTWVIVLLFTMLFVLGILFKETVGPAHGQDYMALCGNADDLIEEGMPLPYPECSKTHYLYGEEYFGTLQKSIFTIFRCLLGDCSSRRGHSLIVHFSLGYGFRFQAVYFLGMILCVFGIFNIITAIFVETTISGLKHNDVQKKRHKMYRAVYVKTKLDALIGRVILLQTKLKASDVSAEELNATIDQIRLSPDEFQKLMQDETVKRILEDLDVDMFDGASLLDIFDPDGSGVIPLTNFFATVMRVRGEPQKSDTIANWVAIRLLSSRFENFELHSLKNQKRIINGLIEISGDIEAFQEEMVNGTSIQAPAPLVVASGESQMPQAPKTFDDLLKAVSRDDTPSPRSEESENV